MRIGNLLRAAGIAATLAAPICSGAVFVVDSGSDARDNEPGDGVCKSNLFSNPCTLRAAVMEANASPGLDVIQVSNDFVVQLFSGILGPDGSAANGDLDIHESLSIFGTGFDRTRISMQGTSRIFEVHDGANLVTFFGLELTGGTANRSGEATGGAIAVGVGDSQVNLSSVRIYDNRGNSGGAIYNDASMDIVFSEIFDNRLVDDAISPQFIRGSAIRNRGQLVIEKSAIHSNDGRTNPEDIGGFAIHSTPINDAFDAPSLELYNVTISNNIGSGLRSQEGVLRIENSTIVEQTRSGVSFGPSAFVDNQLRIENSVIADNDFSDCSIGGNSDDWVLNRYNLDSDGTCELDAGGTNQPMEDPMLGPLSDNGGPTPTHMPMEGSPLIDQGHPSAPGLAIACQPEDQRSVDRPVDGDDNGFERCDIGAVEFEPEPDPEPEPDDLIFADDFDA